MASTVLFDQRVINAQTTGTFILPFSSNVSPYVDGKMQGQPLEFTFHVYFSTGANAGVLKLETAGDPASTGTWAVIGTVTFATEDTWHYVSLTGTFRALRLRFSSNVTGGTASVDCIASSR